MGVDIFCLMRENRHMGTESLPRKLHPDLYERANEPQDADEWPERHLAVSITPTRFVVGCMAVIDCGQGWVKVELETPREMEAELLDPEAAKAFKDWIMEIRKRHLN